MTIESEGKIKMKMKKYSINKRVTMVLSFLLFGLLGFYSCTTETAQYDSITSDDSETQTEADETNYIENFTGTDFDGYTYRVLGSTQDGIFSICTIVDIEEGNTGDIVSDELYNRNRAIEDMYNFKYTAVYVNGLGSTLPAARKSCLAMSDDYDEVTLLDRDAVTMGVEGHIYFVDSVGLELDNPWWDKNAIEDLSIGGKLMFVYGDDCISYLDQTDAVLFNKNILSDFSLDDPYAMVNTGGWTIDKMFEMANAVSDDVNSDEKYDKNDRWGIVTNDYLFFPDVWIGGGEKLVKKDSEDMPYFAVAGNEQLLTILEKIYELTKGDVPLYNAVKDGGTALSNKMFADNQALFTSTVLYSVSVMRAMNSDFGIIPFPKFSEGQDRYYCRATVALPYVVPITNTNLERTNLIMETRAALSADTVVKAYYDITLKGKATRDTESEEMLDLILSSRTTDLGDTLWYASIRINYADALSAKKNNFVSLTEQITKKANKAISDTVDALLYRDSD